MSIVKISGIGYDPREMDPHADPMPPINSGLVPPPYQLIAMPSQFAALSLERLNMGRLPQRTIKSEMFVLRNQMKDSAMEFQWEAAHPLLTSGVVTIAPLSGRILPESFVAIKLTVVAQCAPCICDTQIAVLIRSTAKEEKPKRNNR